MYALHHSEKYVPGPFVFRPERWIDSDQATLRLMHSAFSKFSVGARSCAGKPMAYLESSLTLAKTLWYFDFDTALGKFGELGGGSRGKLESRERPDEYQFCDIFPAMHVGPGLVFRARGNFWKELEPKALESETLSEQDRSVESCSGLMSDGCLGYWWRYMM